MIKKIFQFLTEFTLGNKFANKYFGVRRSFYSEFDSPVWSQGTPKKIIKPFDIPTKIKK